MFALKSSTNTKLSLGSAQKIRSVGLVETNNIFTPYSPHTILQNTNVNEYVARNCPFQILRTKHAFS